MLRLGLQFSDLSLNQNHPGVGENACPGPTQSPQFSGLWWGPRMCISRKFQDADAAGSGANAKTLEATQSLCGSLSETSGDDLGVSDRPQSPS